MRGEHQTRFLYTFLNVSTLTGKSIKNLVERTYVSVAIPYEAKNCTRVLLCIFENEQYLIDKDMRVMQVCLGPPMLQQSLFEESKSIDYRTIIDGYVVRTDKNNSEYKYLRFYPMDTLIINGRSQKNQNYVDFENNKGRLIDMVDYISKITVTRSKNLTNILVQHPFGSKKSKHIDKYIGPTSSKEKGLVSFIKEKLSRNKDSTIFFIPTQGSSRYLEWNGVQRNSIVVQLIEEVKPNYWNIGLVWEKNGKIQRRLQSGLDFVIRLQSVQDSKGTIMQPSMYDFIKIKVNVMNDGTINPLEKIIDPVKVSADEYMGYEETKRQIQSIIYPIDKNMFINTDGKWIIKTSQIILKEISIDKPLVVDN